METQGTFSSDDWSWLDEFLIPDPLDNKVSGEISVAPPGTPPIEGTRYPTNSLFNQDPPEHSDLFVISNGNPFNDAHPGNTSPFASDGPFDVAPPMKPYSTTAVE
jgi:hypothetical protein